MLLRVEKPSSRRHVSVKATTVVETRACVFFIRRDLARECGPLRILLAISTNTRSQFRAAFRPTSVGSLSLISNERVRHHSLRTCLSSTVFLGTIANLRIAY
jgi:hypothetical protein